MERRRKREEKKKEEGRREEAEENPGSEFWFGTFIFVSMELLNGILEGKYGFVG